MPYEINTMVSIEWMVTNEKKYYKVKLKNWLQQKI